MAFFSGLLFIYLTLWAISLLPFGEALQANSTRGTIAAAAMFTLIGIMHFIKKERIESMIPAALPFKRAINYGSGLAEVVLGAALLYSPAKTYAAWGLIILLVIIFPANVNMAITKKTFNSVSRLFFQPLYIAWIWFFCISNGHV